MEQEVTKEAVAANKKSSEFVAEGPVDLASFYASKGGVDLSTLSELTKSVGVSDEAGGVETTSRSKRTCVRVREEISKLEEILKDDTLETKPALSSKPKGGGGGGGGGSAGRGKGRGTGGRSSSGGGGVGRSVAETTGDDVGAGSSVVPMAKKKKTTYSQFTHKRRKRKRKPPEEGQWVWSMGGGYRKPRVT